MKGIRIKAGNLQQRQGGFTLIEVMIALVVQVVGVLGVLSMQVTATKGNSGAMAVSRGVHEITACIDRLAALSFDAPELTAGVGKSAEDLFGPATAADSMAGSFTTAIGYEVIDLDADQLRNRLSLASNFSGSRGKRVVVSSTQQVSGRVKTIAVEYLKIDLGEGG
jgi:prepilin-type N-terminal cleavage/methylation domain-containing protein